MSIYSGLDLQKFFDDENIYAINYVDVAKRFREDEEFLVTEEDGFVLIDNTKTKSRFKAIRVDSKAPVLHRLSSKNKPIFRSRR